MLVIPSTVALYLRLSKDDDNDKPSNSIKNQRLLILNYIAHHQELREYIVMEYCDDGYSGTNFDRPGIMKLLKDVKAKKIQCIVIKDFSRFGRNYIEVGNYLDQIFPFIGVRFISINDYFDSNQNIGCTVGMDVAAKNLIYDYYSKDLSRKVKSALKIKKEQGNYLGGGVPYGYQRSKIEKGKITIDEEAAITVIRIFQLTKEGYNRSEIARALNKEEIPTPSEHLMKHTRRQTLWQPTGKKFYWTMEAVIHILRNEVYLGKTVNGKYKVKDVGSKKTILIPKEEWSSIENTHEPLIGNELFESAQNTFNHKKASIQHWEKDRKSNSSLILTGKMRCGYCNYPMDLIKGKNYYYKCISRRFIINSLCSCDHAIVSVLEDIIISSIQQLGKLFLTNPDKYTKCIQKTNLDVINSDEKIKVMKDVIKRLKLQEARDYEKYRNGLMKMNEYVFNKQKIKVGKKEKLKEIEQLKGKIQYQENEKEENKTEENKTEENKTEEKYKNEEEYNSKEEYKSKKLHKNYNDEITRSNNDSTKKLVSCMIETIYFYDANHIEIVCKFTDEYQLH